jgi:hypothetical protein
MPQMHVTVEFDYAIPDDPEDRIRAYGVANLEKCAEIDKGNRLDDLLAIADAPPEFTIVPKPPTPRKE